MDNRALAAFLLDENDGTNRSDKSFSERVGDIQPSVNMIDRRGEIVWLPDLSPPAIGARPSQKSAPDNPQREALGMDELSDAYQRAVTGYTGYERRRMGHAGESLNGPEHWQMIDILDATLKRDTGRTRRYNEFADYYLSAKMPNSYPDSDQALPPIGRWTRQGRGQQ